MLGPPLSGGVQLKQANTHPRRTLHERATMKDEVHLNNQMSELKSSQLGEPEGILHTPDLGLLKLTPPDLERLFIQSSAQQPPHFLYYPKAASDEQEFAEGFVKALEDLHQQNQLSEAGRVSVERLLASPGAGGPAGLHAADSPVYTTLNGYASSPLGAADSALPSAPPSGAQPRAAASRLQAARPVKDEPQTVPDMQSPGESPPLSPIDMDNQERIKAERKKLRNRIAASKCRKRKLERISRLEDKVKALKTQNIELASTASVLRDQVAQLKQKVMNHVSSGCQLLPNEVQAY